MLFIDAFKEGIVFTIQDKIQASFLVKCFDQAAYNWLEKTQIKGLYDQKHRDRPEFTKTHQKKVKL